MLDSINSFLGKMIEDNDHSFYRSRDPFSYYMRAIKNGIVDDLSEFGVEYNTEIEYLDSFIDDFIEDVEELDEESLTSRQINVLKTLERLPLRQREILEHLMRNVDFDFYKQDFASNSKEIANELSRDISPSTVRANKKKAYENFKKIYNEITGELI